MSFNNYYFTGSGQSLGDFDFTFESYLESSSRHTGDTTFSSDESIESASLTESVWDFQDENGRTYHAYRAGSYPYPNDSPELERLDNQHDILRFLMEGHNYLAPLSHADPPRRMLDIATGTGRWAIEMADEFPTAEVTGTDLSPIQPDVIPPNLAFYVDDATEEWQHGPEWRNLDYIHTRITLGCWSDMASQILRPAFERLRPGGWLECQELAAESIECDDGTANVGGPLHALCATLVKASIDAGRPVDGARLLRGWLEEVGFVDVQERVFRVPLNGWPADARSRQVGRMWRQNIEGGLPALSYALLHRYRGMTKEEIEVELIGVRRDMADQNQHIYQEFHVVWGRKPEDAASMSSGDSASYHSMLSHQGAWA